MKEVILDIFKRYRFDPATHIALGDIRLTIGEQETIAEQILNSLPDDNEIAKRKIEEYINTRRRNSPAGKWKYIEGAQRVIDWLDEEVSDE